MKRREFIKYSATGLAVVAVGSMADWPRFWSGSKARAASSAGFASLELDMVAVAAEMADGIEVPMWAFKLGGHHDDHGGIAAPRIPGPVLLALEGDHIRLKVADRTNSGGTHGFAITGVTLFSGGQAVPEVTVPHNDDDGMEIEFIAPAPGTYMYLDPFNAPVNRVMGLHGVLVVLPNPVGANGTPYNEPTPNIQRLFDDLGRADHYPGHPWDSERNAVWVFNTIDPDKCNLANSSSAVSPEAFITGFLPQYFTLNGKSGFFSSQHSHLLNGGGSGHGLDVHENHLSFASRAFDAQANISIGGTIGQPILIRNLNAGLAWHSPHIHGNHVYQLTDTIGTPLSNIIFLDTWTIPPMARVDLLLPFDIPPDSPHERQVIDLAGNPVGRLAWPPVQEKFPLTYPMHDHNEISNTTAGGNYPHGMVTHWQIDGDLDPLAIVIFVDRADLRIRTGRIDLRGRISRTPADAGKLVELMMRVGGTGGETLGHHITVGDDGSWSFLGRALNTMGPRIVTLMYHDPDDPAIMHASRTVPLRVR